MKSLAQDHEIGHGGARLWSPGLSGHQPVLLTASLPRPGSGPDLTIAHHGGKGPNQLQQYASSHSRLGCSWAPRIPLGPDDNIVI